MCVCVCVCVSVSVYISVCVCVCLVNSMTECCCFIIGVHTAGLRTGIPGPGQVVQAWKVKNMVYREPIVTFI